MIQISDEIYNKLKKDADDNNAIKTIAKWVIGLIIFAILYFTVGNQFLNIQLSRLQSTFDREAAIAYANTTKEVREIEYYE
jgi:hypothetical protein